MSALASAAVARVAPVPCDHDALCSTACWTVLLHVNEGATYALRLLCETRLLQFLSAALGWSCAESLSEVPFLCELPQHSLHVVCMV
jgi:hypothetical protein